MLSIVCNEEVGEHGNYFSDFFSSIFWLFNTTKFDVKFVAIGEKNITGRKSVVDTQRERKEEERAHKRREGESQTGSMRGRKRGKSVDLPFHPLFRALWARSIHKGGHITSAST